MFIFDFLFFPDFVFWLWAQIWILNQFGCSMKIRESQEIKNKLKNEVFEFFFYIKILTAVGNNSIFCLFLTYLNKNKIKSKREILKK